MIRLLNTIILIAFVAANSFSQKDNLPNYNQRNIDFVNKNLRDIKVCCDSIHTVLKATSNIPNGCYEYLKKIDPKNEKILPGDILQIQKKGRKTMEVVVFEIIGESHYKIAKRFSCKDTLSFYLENLKIRKRHQKRISIHRPKHYI
jgi:hypothetical protein